MLRVAGFLVAVVSVCFALKLASSVFAPAAFGLFIIALLWPLQRRLQSYLPRLLALAVVMLVTFVTFVAFGSLVAWGFGQVGAWIARDTARFQVLYEQAAAWLESHGVALSGLWAEHFNVGLLVRAAQGITGRVNTTLSFWIIVFVYVMLGLLEVDGIGRRLAAMQNQTAARVVLDGAAATAAKFRTYMLVRTVMSLITGALVWIFAASIGLPLAAEWGVIAFVLNYIPFLGSFIATVCPAVFALTQFGSWQDMLIVFACLNAIQFIVGSYVEPRVAGAVLAISPSLVLFSVLLWTYLWGLAGVFIGVPIAIAILAFCAQHPSSRWVAELLGGRSHGSAAATP